MLCSSSKSKLQTQHSITSVSYYRAKKYMYKKQDLGNTVASDKTKIMTSW